MLSCVIECKMARGEKSGFSRPFLMGLHNGDRYFAFFNRKPKDNLRYLPVHTLDKASLEAVSPGGSVDRGMRFLLQPKHAGVSIYYHAGLGGTFFVKWVEGVGKAEGFKFKYIPIEGKPLQMLEIRNKTHVWRLYDIMMERDITREFSEFRIQHKTTILGDRRNYRTPAKDQKYWTGYNRLDCWQLHQSIKRSIRDDE